MEEATGSIDLSSGPEAAPDYFSNSKGFPMKKLLIASLLILAYAASIGCAANRAVKTAVASQGAGVAGLVRCADVVSKDPSQGPVLTAALNRAQAQIDAGSPLLGLLTVADPGLDPLAKAALAIISTLLEQKVTDFMAAAQSAISGCRMGILSVPVKP
jgi:hypothetical protein